MPLLARISEVHYETVVVQTPDGTLWVFGAVAVVVTILLIITAAQHRRHAGATERRLCRSCSLPHPPFARFCRRCGRAIGEN